MAWHASLPSLQFSLMHTSPNFKCEQRPSQGGFALVIALSLMAFVLLLLLSITTLVQVESQGAAIQMHRMEAEQAALLSLNIAIGKLQASAGLDQRVTASAEAVDSVNGPKQLTGVWRSWEGRDHETNDPLANGFPIAPDYGSKLVTGDFDIDVSSSGSGRFLSWLVSTAYDESITPAGSLSADLPPDIEEVLGRTVPLVGKGTVGADDAAYKTANEVHLEPTELADGKSAFAWWVSGENTKSSLSQPTTPTSVLDWAERLSSSTRPDTSVFDMTESNELARVSSRSSLNQVSNRAADVMSASQEYFHDLTNYSRGLLTNTATGGWRRDLSLLSEQWADVSTGDFTPIGLPMFTLEPGVQTEARKGGDEVAESGALIYPWAVEGIYLNTESNPNSSHVSGSWDAMVDFATQYKQIVSGSANGNVLLPAYFGGVRDKVSRTLVMSRIHWIFSFYSQRDPSDPSKLRPYLTASPVVTVWNPYNVALKIPGRTRDKVINSRFFDPLPYKLKFSVGGTELTTTFQKLTQISGSGRLNFHLYFDNMTWKPGESRIYSMDRVDQGKNAKMRPGYRSNTGYRWPMGSTGFDPESSFKVELEKYPVAAFKLLIHQASLRVTHATSIDPSVLDQYWLDDTTVTNTKQTLLSVEGNTEPFFTAIMQLRNVLERSTDSLGYAQAKPIIGFTSNLGGAALTNPEAYPLDWRFYMPSNLLDTESIPQSGIANSSYIGTSFRADEGLSRLVVAEVPTRPLRSMGELQHFDINYNNPRPPYIANPIGNSLASHLILPETVSVDESAAVSTRVALDHSYIANHLLYDDWFVSSIAPETEPFSSAELRSVEETYEDFVSGVEPLPNSAYVPAEPLSVAEATDAASDLIDDSTSWHSVASKLEVDGMFNINSTSVAAWTALLKHAAGDKVPYSSVNLENNSWSVALESDPGSPVSRTSVAGDPQANPDPFIQKIGMHQRLTDEQVRALATKIVEQVKARGPFLSLSEFMNRRLSSDLSLARSGAVEAALNELATGNVASENPFADIQSYFTETVTVPLGVTYPFVEAAEGNLAYGFPGWMRQADVLRPIAPILSARDDTFVIRAYGECKDPLTGEAKAGAWCEAVLQRRADYVDATNDEAIILPSEATLTSEINKRFGRRFVIVSFRWLSADEV
jgi:hypothetical protein